MLFACYAYAWAPRDGHALLLRHACLPFDAAALLMFRLFRRLMPSLMACLRSMMPAISCRPLPLTLGWLPMPACLLL